jgi:hypothetical protein
MIWSCYVVLMCHALFIFRKKDKAQGAILSSVEPVVRLEQ